MNNNIIGPLSTIGGIERTKCMTMYQSQISQMCILLCIIIVYFVCIAVSLPLWLGGFHYSEAKGGGELGYDANLTEHTWPFGLCVVRVKQ